MAKSNFETLQAELQLRNDRLSLKGADIYAEDNAAILNAQDGYAIAEMSFNLHSNNKHLHVKHYAYYHAGGDVGSVTLLIVGYLFLFFGSWYLVDRCFQHQEDCKHDHEGGEADDMYK